MEIVVPILVLIAVVAILTIIGRIDSGRGAPPSRIRQRTEADERIRHGGRPPKN